MADLDRNELEQRALRELSRKQLDRATQTYTQILRLAPRDLRIRQKLADLYLRQDRRRDAERQYRQLVKAYQHEGNHRALLSVLQKVRELSPDDFEAMGQMGEAYRNLGRAKEAKPLLEKAWRGLMRQKIGLALTFADMRLDLDPGDIPMLQEIAEGLVSLNMNLRAFGYYQRGIRLYRDRGQVQEMGRLAVRALELKPGEPDLLRAAAKASLAVDDVSTALQHLQPAFANNPQDPIVLDLMASCFEHAGDSAKARRVLMALVEVSRDSDAPQSWLKALERAQKVGEPDLEQELQRAQSAVELTELRLYGVSGAEPMGMDVGVPCVQAEVFCRYGFVSRAAGVLDDARERHPQSLALLAWRAEVALLEDNKKEALRLGGLLHELLTGLGAAKAAERLRSLGANIEVSLAGSEELLEDDELVEDDGLVEDDRLDDELVDDAPTEPPSSADDLDPFATAAPIGDPFAAAGGDPFGAVLGGTFAEIDPDDVDEADPFAGLDLDEDDEPTARDPGEALDEARGLMGMAEFSEAMLVLTGVEGLEAGALRARCMREQGDLSGAMSELRDLLDEAEESEVGWKEAIFELADLAGRAQKPKLALRTLKRLYANDPKWRAKEVSARVRLLRKRLQR